MSLINVRKEINTIDDRMKKLFDDRMKCSHEVAIVKIKEKDDVYKPAREVEICERFAGEEDYITFIKKVMQISRKFQYKIIMDEGVIHKDFFDYIALKHGDVFEKGGILKLDLQGATEAKTGLNISDILSVIADTKLQILKLCVDGTSNKITAEFEVSDKDEARKEALILTYMLYKETI